MADREEESVGSFIRESIEQVEGVEAPRSIDESIFREPLSILSPRKPVVVGPEVSALEAITTMQEESFGCVLVVRGQRLKGIFTERDVLTRIVGGGMDAAKVPLRKVMTADPEYLRPDDSLAYAFNMMSLGGYRHIPLVDNGLEPIGIVSVRDIVTYIVSYFPKSVLNLPTLPRGNYAREREGA